MQILSHNPNPSKTPIASHPPQNTKVDAYMLTMDDESGVDYLFWTDEFTIDADRWWPTRISWSERHDVRDQQTRLAMRFGSQWFVSDVIENPAAKKDFYPRSVELAKLTWHRLDFEPGKSLQIGRSAIAPIGDITAFGIYVEKRRGFKLRYDSVQIDAIPISGSFQLKESAQ
jgi:hypothetical protein